MYHLITFLFLRLLPAVESALKANFTAALARRHGEEATFPGKLSSISVILFHKLPTVFCAVKFRIGRGKNGGPGVAWTTSDTDARSFEQGG